jgi:hypothetical protein
MISLASSFQCRQPHPVSITLSHKNPHRTFASTKFRRNRSLLVQTDTTMEFPPLSSTLCWGRSRESDVDSVVFPESADPSPTPASASVAIVDLWPKVSTPSRSSWCFLSVLPCNLQFCGRCHLIPFSLSFSLCTVRINLHEHSAPCTSGAERPNLPRVQSIAFCASHRSLLVAGRPEAPPQRWPPLPVVRPSSARLQNPAAAACLQRRWAHHCDPLALLPPFRNPPRLLATQSPGDLMRLEFWYAEDLLFVLEPR